MRNQEKKEKTKAYLFGPFLGELSWEFYRFAPYAIYLKKENPDIKLIVLTRESRFGLYGTYADILIPLRIKNDVVFEQSAFGLTGYKAEYYDSIKKYFYEKYQKRFDIVDHFCPLIHGWRKRIRWQFPREKMEYDFNSSEKVKNLVRGVIRSTDIIIDHKAVGYTGIESHKEVNSNDLFKKPNIDVLIESLKECECVIGNMKYNVSRLAVLLKKNLISLHEELSNDSINLLNPFNIPIIKCNTIMEGMEAYENNFRSEKSWTGKQWRFIHFS